MKRPILKRTVKTIEVVTWTLEYEDAVESSPSPPASPVPPPERDEPPPSKEKISPHPPQDELSAT